MKSKRWDIRWTDPSCLWYTASGGDGVRPEMLNQLMTPAKEMTFAGVF
jgi:hypothetical protein